MPKIEVSEQSLRRLIGRPLPSEELEGLLTVAKGELDGRDGDLLKVELNDTNRPDLWSTAGLARALRVYLGGAAPRYDFFSTPQRAKSAGERVILVDPALREIRPFIAGFAATGRKLDETALKDLIQTQEKLCWNFGRKRQSIAMGVYRSDAISYPIHYRAADPDATRFAPLGAEPARPMSLRQILRDHPKGQEFGSIVSSFPRFPYLEDSRGATLSFPPIINSADVGAVQAGDSNLFVELTGTDLSTLLLAASIVACDLADEGFTILPVAVRYPEETPFGREVVTPLYFQTDLAVEIDYANKLLGVSLSAEEAAAAVRRMGCPAAVSESRITVTVPEYRNDFLHPVDIVEDIMMARGVESFEPEPPSDFTVGRLTEAESLARRVKDVLIGLGYQEMIFNYLGSGLDFVERMGVSPEGMVRIANPMSESFEYVRRSVLPALLDAESVSAHATYPHLIFEVGKVSYLDAVDVSGTVTRDYLGLMIADKEAGFNQVRAHLAVLFYYLAVEHTLEATSDSRFIPGRCAAVVVGGKRIGLFGEIHPQVLENWGIQMPCAGGEIDLGLLP